MVCEEDAVDRMGKKSIEGGIIRIVIHDFEIIVMLVA